MLIANLAGHLPVGVTLSISPDAIGALPPVAKAIYLGSFTAALRSTFLCAAAVGVLGFVLSWFLKELPLRGLAPIADMVTERRAPNCTEQTQSNIRELERGEKLRDLENMPG
jgi:hypothetical protein